MASFSWNPAKGLEHSRQRMDKEEEVTSFTLVIHLSNSSRGLTNIKQVDKAEYYVKSFFKW